MKSAFVESPTGREIPIRLQNQEQHKAWLEKSDALGRNLVELNQFKAKFKEALPITDSEGCLREVLLGVEGLPDDPRSWIHLFAKASKSLPVADYMAALDAFSPDIQEQAMLGWALGRYSFKRYKKDEEQPLGRLAWPKDVDPQRVIAMAEATAFGRDLINTPALDQSPKDLATSAIGMGELQGAEVTVISGEALLEKNFPAVYAVGMGSFREPCLIDLRWGNPDHPAVTLVGKGVVFDTGGVNLKNASGMRLMKKDMGGGALALALGKLIMTRRLPVRLRILVPAVENSPGNKAFRPGDVIQTRSGKTVEIGNTDAEGRVILCDALTEAVNENPNLLLDFATLTGAARVALGQDLPPFWTPNDSWAVRLEEAARKSGDPMWRMPLWEPYSKHLRSSIADLSNMADTGLGGAITAALYLHEFVKPFQDWIHVDLYGWRSDSNPGFPKGGEVTAIRALFTMLETRYGTP